MLKSFSKGQLGRVSRWHAYDSAFLRGTESTEVVNDVPRGCKVIDATLEHPWNPDDSGKVTIDKPKINAGRGRVPAKARMQMFVNIRFFVNSRQYSLAAFNGVNV